VPPRGSRHRILSKLPCLSRSPSLLRRPFLLIRRSARVPFICLLNFFLFFPFLPGLHSKAQVFLLSAHVTPPEGCGLPISPFYLAENPRFNPAQYIRRLFSSRNPVFFSGPSWHAISSRMTCMNFLRPCLMFRRPVQRNAAHPDLMQHQALFPSGCQNSPRSLAHLRGVFSLADFPT